jgi:anti-sigma B factor antagonist
MHFSTEKQDDVVIFTLKGRSLDSSISANVKAEILIVSQPDLEALIIDLSSVELIDSTGMGCLLLAHRQLKDYDIPVILVGVRETVAQMLKLLHIYDIFEYSNSVNEVFSTN